jgi:hypothetical protein
MWAQSRVIAKGKRIRDVQCLVVDYAKAVEQNQ